jgi:hypothetical protein
MLMFGEEYGLKKRGNEPGLRIANTRTEAESAARRSFIGLPAVLVAMAKIFTCGLDDGF